MACCLSPSQSRLDPVGRHTTVSIAASIDLFQGFFRSLFTAGFVEASPKHFAVPDEVDIAFDDHNITRAGAYNCIPPFAALPDSSCLAFE